MASLFRWYSRCLERSPMVTKCVTSAGLFATGDLIAQKVDGTLDSKSGWNPLRTGKMAGYGAVVFAPLCHVWYVNVLGRLIPGTSGRAVVSKVMADQILFGPLGNSIFLASTVLMNGGSLDKASQKVQNEIWPVMKMNWTVWPLAQLINFRFVPVNFQVLFVNTVVLGWSSYLCVKAHESEPHDD